MALPVEIQCQCQCHDIGGVYKHRSSLTSDMVLVCGQWSGTEPLNHVTCVSYWYLHNALYILYNTHIRVLIKCLNGNSDILSLCGRYYWSYLYSYNVSYITFILMYLTPGTVAKSVEGGGPRVGKMGSSVPGRVKPMTYQIYTRSFLAWHPTLIG